MTPDQRCIEIDKDGFGYIRKHANDNEPRLEIVR